LCDGLQARFGKTRLAEAMRCVYDQPKTLVWGAQLMKKYRKAYAMAEVTPPYITHFILHKRVRQPM